MPHVVNIYVCHYVICIDTAWKQWNTAFKDPIDRDTTGVEDETKDITDPKAKSYLKKNHGIL